MTFRNAPRTEQRPREDSALAQPAPEPAPRIPDERKPAKPDITRIRIGFSDWASI